MPRGVPRTAGDRYRKWKARFKPDHYAWVVEATMDIASEKMMQYQADYEVILRNVKAVLADYPSEAFRTQEYMWYALKLYHCLNRYREQALRKCANAATVFFAVLGLNSSALYGIARSLGVNPDPIPVIVSGLGVVAGKPRTVNMEEGPVTVTNTSPLIVASIAVEGLLYIEGVHLLAENPPGSGTPLNIRVVVLHSEGSTLLTNTLVIDEGVSFDDWLRFILDDVPDGVELRGVAVEAWVNDAPPQGLEPQVTIGLTGVRMETT